MADETTSLRIDKVWPGEPGAAARSLAERLEVLELIESLWRLANAAGEFDSSDLRMVRLVTIAELQGRPHDLSSLAEALGLPRATVMRRVAALSRRGLLVKRNRGRRTVVRGSDALKDRFGPVMDEMIERIVRYVEDARPRRR